MAGLVMDRQARRLYYSVPNLQRISSVSLAGGEKASLPLTTIARDLAIDSALARICWVSLRNAVECSLLDGTNRTIVHLIGMWKEQKVGTGEGTDLAQHFYSLILTDFRERNKLY